MADNNNEDTCSDASERHQASRCFLTRGAFLLTPSHDLTLDRAANICDKMNFHGDFSVTKTATGILFRFSDPDDYQAVFRRGFHRATGGRLYRKVVIPCRPQRTFVLVALEIPVDLPEEDIRAALYRYNSIVEVSRLTNATVANTPGMPQLVAGSPPPVRITLASLDEYNSLVQHGLEFYGATYFPTEPISVHRPSSGSKNGLGGGSTAGSIVFDATGFTRIPAPATKTLRVRHV